MAMALLARTASAATASTSIAQVPSLAAGRSQPPPRCLGRRWSRPVGLRRRVGGGGFGAPADPERKSMVSMAAALPDFHSFAFLAMDMVNSSDFPVSIELDPTREIVVERYTVQLSEEAIKSVYMAFGLFFCWGCCVFGSMNDVFYDSEMYRKAGGNGTGHWIYDRQEEEERAAREEMWSDDLIKEIEEKAEEVRKAEEEKEVELV